MNIPVVDDVLVGEKKVKILSDISDLLAHSVAVNHEHDGPGAGAELVHHLASHPVVPWHVHQVDRVLVLQTELELVVLHAGVGLHTLASDQLREDGGLATVTDTTQQNI